MNTSEKCKRPHISQLAIGLTVVENDNYDFSCVARPAIKRCCRDESRNQETDVKELGAISND